MAERPDAAEILDIVASFLRQKLMPALPERLAFECRLAANVVDLVKREITLCGQNELAEVARLRILLNRDGTRDILVADFADRLRRGELSPAMQLVSEHLWVTAIDKLLIDQPGYASLLKVTEANTVKGNSNEL